MRTYKKMMFGIFIISLSCCHTNEYNKKNKTDIENNHLQGKVKSLKQTCRKLIANSNQQVKDSLFGGPYHNYVMNFDENGKLIETYYYTQGGKVSYRTVYYRDKNEYIIKTINEDVNHNELSKSICVNDSNGNMIEVKASGMDGRVTSRNIYAYDSNGNQIEAKSYNSAGLLESKTVYKYDSEGNIIESSGIESNDRISWKSTCKYDDKKNLIEEYITPPSMETNSMSLNTNEIIHNRFEYKFDAQGNWIEKKHLSTRGSIDQPTLLYIREIEYF